MSLTRRQFLWSAAATAALSSPRLREPWVGRSPAQASPESATGPFRHGVASGDPQADRVMLWTRVTPARGSDSPVDVRWRIATDDRLSQVAAEGTARTSADRDFTVKVDAGGLRAGRPYYYVFEAGGDRSSVGHTRTLPAGATDRVRLASLCCSNYPAGFFNVYRCVANRNDLDAVVHVGDYIYEFENGRYGDGSGLLRIPGTAQGGGHAQRLPHPLRDVSQRSRSAGGTSPASVHCRVGRPRVTNDAWSAAR